MDRMAAIAEQHYRRHLPERYAALDDPEAFFQMLSDEADEQIEASLPGLEGPDPENETFAEKMSRYQWARFLAEAQVFREVLLPEPASTPTPDDGDDQEFLDARERFQALRAELLDRQANRNR